MRSVYFLTNSPPYNTGERAGFDEATCERLVKNKQAMYWEDYLKQKEDQEEEESSEKKKAPAKKKAAKKSAKK